MMLKCMKKKTIASKVDEKFTRAGGDAAFAI
jgi:hypothetical protein